MEISTVPVYENKCFVHVLVLNSADRLGFGDTYYLDLIDSKLNGVRFKDKLFIREKKRRID